ncbi:DUF835 domain-containing protein [Thermococcus sp.]|nr:DUF835 domain-containing protein [Thermococcus sp.]
MLKALAPLLAGAIIDRTRSSSFKIVRSLKEIPEERAVVIGRAGERVPPSWELITVSAARGFFGPRELHRVLEGIVASLKNDPDRAIVIACPEYLALHNGFRALIKFLNDVRDYSILFGGRVYLVTDELAWDPREFALLKRLED